MQFSFHKEFNYEFVKVLCDKSVIEILISKSNKKILKSFVDSFSIFISIGDDKIHLLLSEKLNEICELLIYVNEFDADQEIFKILKDLSSKIYFRTNWRIQVEFIKSSSM